MSVGPELSIMYHHNNQQYYNSAPLIQHQQYRILQEPSQQQRSSLHDQVMNGQHNKQQNKQRQQQEQSFSPPLSIASSSSTSSGSNLSSSPPPAALNYHVFSSFNFMHMKKKLSTTLNTVSFSDGTSSTVQQQSQSKPSAAAATWNFTWLVFMSGKWVPFDALNQTKLEQTLTMEGTFVDINDSHFPDVKKVRVFPKSNYLSYLGIKYRLSRIMQPDAYLDHVGIAEAKKYPTLSLPLSSLPTADEGGDNRIRKVWEM
ncbi:hypothetical protein BD408DRAFT_419523 [Parasitella parasitica]|nr:hypothetical protein BD408DRAFT_419523 [Parasitella parasitica]